MPDPLTLFDPSAPPMLAADVAQPVPGTARAADPETSKRAARNVMPRTGSSRAHVLLAFDQYNGHPDGGFTDDELYLTLGDQRSSRWRTARHELAAEYDPPLLVHAVGEERSTRGGQSARVWRITTKGSQVAHEIEMEAFGQAG